MAADSGLALDFLKQVTNVHWGGLAFLYSGADGMFGSKDGEQWEEAPLSVPATSLAWVDGVWVACGPDGTWRSEDGAKTWESSGPELELVAAMKPTGLDEEGQPLPGMFAGIGEDADGNGLVYSSSDGKSWAVALTIFSSFGDGGTENITGLSGCGGAFFVGTVHSVNRYSSSTAKFYSSDGGGFSSQIVATGTFWDGDLDHVPPVFEDYSPAGVGYDKKNKTYLATIDKEERPFGIQHTYLQASESSGGSFDEGSIVDQATLVAATNGDFLAVYSSVAGGDGAFVGGSGLDHISGELPTGGEVRAHWLPGGGAGQTLESYTGALTERSIGSFCFNPTRAATGGSTDEPDKMGVFACVASGTGSAGGVYIATAGGSFRKTHSGNPWAVAVGKISFLGSTDAGL